MIAVVLAAFAATLRVSVQCPAGPPASWIVVLVLGGLRAGFEIVVDLMKQWDR
jgi:hypothetical protein